MNGHTNLWLRKIILLVFVIGIISSVMAAVWVERANKQQVDKVLQDATERAANAVTKRIELYQYGLRGARGVLLAAGEWGISREMFRAYSEVRDIDLEFPGARGFGFIRRVDVDEQKFIARAQADGMADFDIHQLTPHDGERFVIQYIEPVKRNLAAIGFDIASEDNRRIAALAAMASGEVRITGPITLLQATGKPLQSFLILLPIYRGGITPESVEERMAKGYGWTFAPLLTEEVLQSLQLDRDGLQLHLSDITEPENEKEFYASDSQQSGQQINLQHAVQRQIYGRTWKIELRTEPEFVAEMNQNSPIFVAFIGFLGSTMLAGFSGIFVVSQQRQRQIKAEQARSAAIVDSSSDAIIGQLPDGIIVSWNQGAEKIFGYHASEVIGHTLLDVVVPNERKNEEKSLFKRIANGEKIDNFDTILRCKGGRLIDVSVSVSSMRDDSDSIIGISSTIRDISVSKAAEARILELNTRLEEQVFERTKELRELNILLNNVLQSASEVSIIATDLEGVIRVFNSGAERLLGYSAAEMIGLQTPAILHLPEEVDARRIALSDKYGQPIEGFRVFVHEAELEGADNREWVYVRKDGSHISVTLLITAMRDADGHLVGYLGIALDLTKEYQLRRETMVALEQLALASEVAGLGIWSWTPADNQLQWNKRMYDLYDLPMSSQAITYEQWRSRLHPEDLAITEAKLQDALDGTTIFDSIFRIVRNDGEVLHIQPGAHIERDIDGKPLSVIGINLDITAQLRLEADLRQAKVQADAASEAKSSFLANMSHEIRTPLNAVLGMLQLMQSTRLNARQLDYVLKAKGAAKSLLGLINDVLDYSKIEANMLRLDRHHFELEPLLNDLAVVLSGNQRTQDVEVLFDIDTELPCMLDGDSLRLQQVMINLAGNALKFTHNGHVIVSLQQLQRTADKVKMRVVISDTGIGMNEAQLQRIFDSFTQAEASTTRRYGGSGLGLGICKRLVELMGGELEVESTLDKGSRFWFELEFGIANGTSLKLASRIKTEDSRVLIVDNNPLTRELLQRTAHELGWHADKVAGDDDALKKLQGGRKRYDVVLMDLRLPTAEEIDDLQLIRECKENKTPVVLVVTANERELLISRYGKDIECVAGYIYKPMTPQQLALGLSEAGKGGVKKKSPQEGHTSRQRLEGLNLLVVEDNFLNRQVARELLLGEGANVSLAEGGQQGINLVLSAQPPFDAVLMDIQMPHMDGLEATRRIRQHFAGKELPIIAMTANVSNTDRDECLAAGMNDHSVKPIDIEKLVAVVQKWCGRSTIVDSSADALASTEEAEVILKRFGGNLALLHSMMETFQTDMNKLLSEAELSFRSNDHSRVLANLHTLKGNAGTMGARTLFKLAGEIEQYFKQLDDLSAVGDEWILTLKHSIEEDCLALDAMFHNFEQKTVLQELNVDESLEKSFEKLMVQLELGNLAALDTIEILSTRVPEQLAESFGNLRQSVHSIDFKRSQLILRNILSDLNGA